jgi:hypothetical protein
MAAARTCHISEFGPTGFDLYRLSTTTSHEVIPCMYTTPTSVAQILFDHVPHLRKHATAFNTATGRRVHPYEVAPATLSVVITPTPTTPISSPAQTIAVVYRGGIIPVNIPPPPVSFSAIYSAFEDRIKHQVSDDALGIIPIQRDEPVPISRSFTHSYNGQVVCWMNADGDARQPNKAIYPPSHATVITPEFATDCVVPRKKGGTIVLHIGTGISTAVPPNTTIGAICLTSSTGILACGSQVIDSPKPHAYTTCTYTYTINDDAQIKIHAP